MAATVAKGFISPEQLPQMSGKDVTTDSLGRRLWWFHNDDCWITVDLDTGECEIGEPCA